MKAYIYQIEAISNLHVGNGEANEGVVDRLIQKDPVTGFPIINASSLKGAFREHLKHKLSSNKDSSSIISYIFGNEVNEKQTKTVTVNEGGKERGNATQVLVHQAGAYRFFDANLLSLPVRNDHTAYFMATCLPILKELNHRCELFNVQSPINFDISLLPSSQQPTVNKKQFANAAIEDLENKTTYADYPSIDCLGDSPSVLLSEKDFKQLCSEDYLPVIARNQLDNGLSQNLWYEQVLPRFSRLYFIVMVPHDDTHFDEFDHSVTSSLVQIGANASVGYGYCSIKLLSTIAPKTQKL